MDEERWKDVLEELDRDVIAEFAEALALNETEFARKPIEEFASIVGTFATSMAEGLRQLVGASTFESIETELKNTAFVLLIERLNEALPHTHPYCVGIAEHTNKDGKSVYTLGAFSRIIFPELLTNTDPHIIPHYRVEKRPPLLDFFSMN